MSVSKGEPADESSSTRSFRAFHTNSQIDYKFLKHRIMDPCDTAGDWHAQSVLAVLRTGGMLQVGTNGVVQLTSTSADITELESIEQILVNRGLAWGRAQGRCQPLGVCFAARLSCERSRWRLAWAPQFFTRRGPGRGVECPPRRGPPGVRA